MAAQAPLLIIRPLPAPKTMFARLLQSWNQRQADAHGLTWQCFVFGHGWWDVEQRRCCCLCCSSYPPGRKWEKRWGLIDGKHPSDAQSFFSWDKSGNLINIHEELSSDWPKKVLCYWLVRILADVFDSTSRYRPHNQRCSIKQVVGLQTNHTNSVQDD